MKKFLLCCFLLDVYSLSAAPLEDKNFVEDDMRIVGGYLTTIAEVPYQASLQQRGFHICGATIISARALLTAAHCFEDPLETALYRVRVGSTGHASGGQLLGVRRVLLHEQYSNATQDNDVALVEVAAEIRFSAEVSPVALGAMSERSTQPQQLTVSGWGLTHEMNADVSPMLRCVEVDVLPRTDCVKSYREIATITERMFCAASSGRDSCQGDSGGPLVGRVRGERRLFGIVSWGIGCAQPDFPGVYADVGALRPWIERAMLSLRKRI